MLHQVDAISVEALVDALKGTSNQDGFTPTRAILCVALPPWSTQKMIALRDPFDEIRMCTATTQVMSGSEHGKIRRAGPAQCNCRREEDQRHATRLAHRGVFPHLGLDRRRHLPGRLRRWRRRRHHCCRVSARRHEDGVFSLAAYGRRSDEQGDLPTRPSRSPPTCSHLPAWIKEQGLSVGRAALLATTIRH